MRWLTIILIAGSVIAAPALVRTCVVGNESNTASISCSMTNTAHNFLIITTTAVRHASAPSLSDTLGNTFVTALTYTDTTQPDPDGTLKIWYVADCKGGANVITNTPASGNAALEIHVSEWTGMSGWTPDQTSSDSGQMSTTITSPSRTTTANGELIFGYTFPAGNASAGAGFTGLTIVNGDLDEYLIQTSAGSIAATFTQSMNGYWLVGMVTFMAPSTGGGSSLAGAATLLGSGVLH